MYEYLVSFIKYIPSPVPDGLQITIAWKICKSTIDRTESYLQSKMGCPVKLTGFSDLKEEN